jgi:phenylacetate-CoA ligase
LLSLDVCRKNDLIVTPGGRRIYPAYFVHLLDGHSGIGQFQFVQTGPGSIVLKLCARQDVVDLVRQALQSRLQTDLGSDMSFQVERVVAIPRSRSGKHRFVTGMRAD